MKRALPLLTTLITTLFGCDLTGDGGMSPPPDDCPAALPSAAVTTSSGAQQATLDTEGAWTAVTWATSEIAAGSDNTDVTYLLAQPGSLTAIRREARRRRVMDAELKRLVYTPERLERLAFEHTLRAYRPVAPVDPRRLRGTAIRGRTQELLPDGVERQDPACSDSDPRACGDTMLCVIPEGMSDGTCESMVTLKMVTSAGNQDVSAVVRKVGASVAILVDSADDAALSASDSDELAKRFDEHIAPRVHQLFGEPKDPTTMRDRDGNGVVIMFVTSKVADAGDAVVGYFRPQDIMDPGSEPTSNGADLLYLRPPGGNVTLDNLSGTMAHEYQHLINYFAKVVINDSDQEERWLDEGLSTFAEDITGYGADAFTNAFAYLRNAGDTSLTGFGLIASTEDEADGFERRGFAYLMVRHVFEHSGGADYPDGPGALTDRGGVAAIRSMVQTDDTGIDALSSAAKRPFHTLMGDLGLAISIDGTRYGCLGGFQTPEDDAYTNFQRGLDLQKSVPLPGGNRLEFMGPTTVEFEAISVPFPFNAIEFRNLTTTAAGVQIGAQGADDGMLGLHAYSSP